MVLAHAAIRITLLAGILSLLACYPPPPKVGPWAHGPTATAGEGVPVGS